MSKSERLFEDKRSFEARAAKPATDEEVAEHLRRIGIIDPSIAFRELSLPLAASVEPQAAAAVDPYPTFSEDEKIRLLAYITGKPVDQMRAALQPKPKDASTEER